MNINICKTFFQIYANFGILYWWCPLMIFFIKIDFPRFSQNFLINRMLYILLFKISLYNFFLSYTEYHIVNLLACWTFLFGNCFCNIDVNFDIVDWRHRLRKLFHPNEKENFSQKSDFIQFTFWTRSFAGNFLPSNGCCFIKQLLIDLTWSLNIKQEYIFCPCFT